MILVSHFIHESNPLTGNLINQLEYFLFLQNKNIPCKLLLLYYKLDYEYIRILIKKLLHSRYSESCKYSTKDIIICSNHNKTTVFKSFIKLKYSYMILTDETYYILFNIYKFPHNEAFLYIINSWYSFYNNMKISHINYIRLNENKLCGDVNYLKKIWPQYYINDDRDNNNAFILCNGERRLLEDEIEDIINKYYNTFDNIYICSNYMYNNYKLHYVNVCYNYSLFSLYNTFIYVPTKTYEFAPRMLLESYLLRKNIEIYKFPDNNNNRLNEYMKRGNMSEYILTSDDFIFKDIGI